jgi:hypothetical protein
MRKLILLAGIAALSVAVPAAAEAQGRGHGRSHGARAQQQTQAHVNRDRARARAATRAQARAEAQRRARRNSNGTWVDRNRDGINDRAQNRYGGAACPPGLANRTPACVPPGQARRMFNEGQRIPTNYGAFTSYNDIPMEYRQQYNIPVDQNYIYRDNMVYVVDPRTRLVTDIINLIRR